MAAANPSFDWVRVDRPHLRFYFPRNSYPAAQKQSLIRRAVGVRPEILRVLGAKEFNEVVDIFYIESRAEMDSLVGFPVTGFAARDERTVFLVTNPEWRAFERHEMMHIYAHHIWGPASGAWVEEGLAQFMDGRCGRYSIHDVVHAMAESGGYVPMDTLVTKFRQLDDLTAYLQAASMVGYIYETYGRGATRAVWKRGLPALREVTRQTPSSFADSWWRWVRAKAQPVPKKELKRVADKGCG